VEEVKMTSTGFGIFNLTYKGNLPGIQYLSTLRFRYIMKKKSLKEINKKRFIMNTIHPNIAVLQRFNPANISTSIGVIAEDTIFHYFNPMIPDLQGDYFGRQGFMEFSDKKAGQSKGTFKVTLLSITPLGDELVVTHIKDNMTLNDQQLEIDAVVVWRILDGKIKEAWDIPAVYHAIISDTT
jgi:predicted SnoaL-like aldol condensation-catalyzing enzyme